MEHISERKNVEIKAVCPDPAVAREAALRLAGPIVAVLDQLDTYFHVPDGRLKLREINDASAELIFYRRPDDLAARLSRYQLVPVPDPAATKALLSAALGVRTVVRKRRELLLYGNVRIHLDSVENLGHFIELEAVLSGQNGQAESLQRLERVTGALGILPEHRLAGSYGELVRSNATKTPP
jgi:predicted adenylyl cyclase CyaB